MRFLYTLALYLLCPFVLLRLFYLGIKNPAYRAGWLERLGFISRRKAARRIIWLHAVSVGEVNAARALVEYLLKQHADFQILITTVTPSGAAMVKRHFAGQVQHGYFPYDLPFAVRCFLRRVKPVIFITMETEIWPNLFHACRARGVPVLIINARLSAKSKRRYQRLAALTRETLSIPHVIAAQGRADAERFIELGAPGQRVHVTGNLKFDVHIPPGIEQEARALGRCFPPERPIWIAASTRPGEEAIILKAQLDILRRHPGAILILAPRHPERTDKIAALCRQHGLNPVQRSSWAVLGAGHRVYLLDTLGELPPHYAVAQVAFVGGSLVREGGHNMLEPAALGLPVICGPHTHNFSGIVALLRREAAITIVKNGAELAATVNLLFSDADSRQKLGARARQTIAANKGNLKPVIELIKPYLRT